MPHTPEESQPQRRRPDDLRTILVPTDFSDIANAALDYAGMLARKLGSKVIATHVLADRLYGAVGDYPSVGDVRTVIELQKEQADRRLEEVAESRLPKEIEVELRCTEGVPHVEIVRLAQENNADLIVMATHGRGFISHLLLGSTTEQVIRRSSCPVLVVRPDRST
jgi:nucleotide-binding universal stress UspA family protein